MDDLKGRLVSRALGEGFVACRVCKPSDVPDMPERLRAFIEAGYHGQMGWMADRMAWRGDPSALWPQARSVIMLAESYAPEYDPTAVLELPEKAAVSVYAQGRDYHDIVKKRLKRLARWLIEQEACEVKVFVDTAPVPEKALGQAAGLGWQGKHTNLVSRDWGNWAFLGAIFTTLELPVDAAEADHCGSCRSCLEACPTDAFPAPYRLDARRCISYLTIEHKGPVDLELRGKMGNRIYGCDDCLAVCPWNKFASAAREAAFHARAELKLPGLDELAALDDAAFREVFSGSPIKRIGRDRFVRNVCIAIGNSGAVRFVPQLEDLVTDESALVRGAAAWALLQLDAERFSFARAQNVPGETDPDVLREWNRGA